MSFNRPSSLVDAVFKGNVEKAQRLLAERVLSPEEKNRALREASIRDSAELVGLLLECGADPTADDFKAFFDASNTGSLLALETLFLAHAPPQEVLDRLLAAASCENSVDAEDLLSIVGYLLRSGADPSASDFFAFINASRNGNPGVVAQLLKARAPTQAALDLALVHASKEGHLPVVELLLASGANVNAAKDMSVSALGWASNNPNRRDVSERLLRAGANPTHFRHLREEAADDPTILLHVQPGMAKYLYDLEGAWWKQRMPKVVHKIQALHRKASDRLDKPPTAKCGKACPSREDLIKQMRTAGRRFAREWWAEGASITLGDVDVGALPKEFEEVRLPGARQMYLPSPNLREIPAKVL